MTSPIATAIARRNIAPCTIPVLGDSVTLGQGATAITSRWASVASASLRAMYPTSGNGSNGGLGFLGMVSTSPGLTYTWPVSLVSGSWTDDPLGPVRKGWSMSGTGSWSWTTPAGTTSIRVMYYGTGNGSQVSVTVGGGSPVTITDTPPQTADGVLSASIPCSGAQTVTIAYVSGGSLFIDGVLHYAGDESAGITVHACGHYGWTARNGEWNGADGFSGFPFQPSLAPIGGAGSCGFFLGINDCQFTDAATFQGNMITLINSVMAPVGSGGAGLSGPPIIVIPYQPNVTVVDSGGWNAYVTALENVAGNYSGAILVNLNANMPPVISGGSLYVDTVHPSNSGHAEIAAIFTAALPAPSSSGLLMASGII